MEMVTIHHFLLVVCIPEWRGWRTIRLYFAGSLQLDSSSDLGSVNQMYSYGIWICCFLLLLLASRVMKLSSPHWSVSRGPRDHELFFWSMLRSSVESICFWMQIGAFWLRCWDNSSSRITETFFVVCGSFLCVGFSSLQWQIIAA